MIGFIGGCLSTISLASCAFLNKIEYYFIFFSFLFGIGQSLLLIATFAILPHYFNKKIGLANGLMNLGGALVCIGVPLVIAKCLKELGLDHTWYLIFSTLFIFILKIDFNDF